MNRNIILLSLVLLLIYTLLEYMLAPSLFSVSYLHKTLLVVTISTYLFICLKEPNTCLYKQYFRGSNLFLISFCLVHFQIYLDYILGNISSLNLNFPLNYAILNKASLTSAMALVIYYIGYVYKTMNPGVIRQTKSPQIYQTKFLYYLCYIFFALFIISVNPDYIRGRSYGVVQNLTEEIGGVIPLYSQSYFLYCVYGIILVTTYNLRQKKTKLDMPKYLASFKKPFIFSVLIFTTLIILSGDRGPIIRIGIALFAGFILQSRKKMNITLIFTALLIASTFIYILGYFRATDTSLDVSERYTNALTNSELSQKQNSIFPAGMELATVVRAYHSIYDVVERNGINGGEGQLIQALGIIPGLGLLYTTLAGRDMSKMGSASIATAEMGADHGMGTTTVADILLDFGLLGVLIVFFLFGILSRYLDYNMYNATTPTLWIFVLGFTFILAGIIIGRATIIYNFRDASLIYIIIYLTTKLNSRKHSKILSKINNEDTLYH